MNRLGMTMAIAMGMSGMAFAGTNLVANGDFEGATTGWIKYNTSTGVSTLSFVDSAAHSGTKGARMHVTAASTENWHVQLKFPVISTVAQTVYRLSYWAKGPDVSTHVGISDNAYVYLTGFTQTYTSTWTKFQGTFIGDGTKRRIAASLGLDTGVYDFDDVVIEAIGVLDSTWYANADTRIDSLRKNDFGVQVLQDGVAAADIPVTFQLVRHDFPFGTALNFHDDADDDWYKQMAAKYFWAGVTENAFKWPQFEPTQDAVDSATVDKVLDWTESQGWALMRGHALEWGIEKYNFASHWSRQGTCAEYQVFLKHRIDRDMAFYKGRFRQYDVWNEAFHEPAIFNRCGWELLDSAFIWAHAADPTAQLFLNEYSVVAGGETGTFVDLIKGLQARNIPISGIGAQCHFGNQVIDPAVVAMRLSELGALGLPIMVTEFDVGDMTDGNLRTAQEQADQDAMFIRAAFSHPAVQGIILWGFWDSRHWVPDGGIIEEDKTPKLAADSIWNLWNKDWTTSGTNVSTNASGLMGFRGFNGKYVVTVGAGINAQTDTLQFDANHRVWTYNMDGSKPLSLQKPARARLVATPAGLRIYDLAGRQLKIKR